MSHVSDIQTSLLTLRSFRKSDCLFVYNDVRELYQGLTGGVCELGRVLVLVEVRSLGSQVGQVLHVMESKAAEGGLDGAKPQGVWGRESPSGVHGQSPGRGLGDEVARS